MQPSGSNRASERAVALHRSSYAGSRGRGRGRKREHAAGRWLERCLCAVGADRLSTRESRWAMDGTAQDTQQRTAATAVRGAEMPERPFGGAIRLHGRRSLSATSTRPPDSHRLSRAQRMRHTTGTAASRNGAPAALDPNPLCGDKVRMKLPATTPHSISHHRCLPACLLLACLSGRRHRLHSVRALRCSSAAQAHMG